MEQQCLRALHLLYQARHRIRTPMATSSGALMIVRNRTTRQLLELEHRVTHNGSRREQSRRKLGGWVTGLSTEQLSLLFSFECLILISSHQILGRAGGHVHRMEHQSDTKDGFGTLTSYWCWVGVVDIDDARLPSDLRRRQALARNTDTCARMCSGPVSQSRLLYSTRSATLQLPPPYSFRGP